MAQDPQGADSEERKRRLGEELRRLQETHQASEGNKILGRTYAFARSYKVFRGNYAALRYFLDHFAATAVHVHMWNERHRYRIDYAKDEVARLLHNFVAAALSLGDATRNFLGEYYAGTALLNDYEIRKDKDFAHAPLHNFLKRLRVYTLHLRLPATTAVASIKRREDGGTDFDNAFKLDVDKLREWDGWTAKAREYLDTLGSEVDLREIIDEYEPIVRAFHEWLSKRIIDEHTEAIEDLFDLERRMMKVEREWRISWGDPEALPDETAPERSRESLDALYAKEDARSDFATIDDVISTLYESISFPHGGLPNLDRFRSLFLPDAQFIEVESEVAYLSNVNRYVTDWHKALHEGSITAVTETEVARRTNPMGNVAHVLSFHKTRYIENATEKHSEGLYDLHLVKAGDRWVITGMHLCQGYGIALVRSPGEAPDQPGVEREAPAQGA